MTYGQALLLGVLQGLGEFLPVSSSAHLALAPWIFRFPDPGLSFDVALHVGTLVAVTIAFGRRWSQILLGTVNNPRGEESRKLLILVAATLPAAVAGLALEKKAEAAFRDPRLIAGALALFGLIMAAADQWGKKIRDWAIAGVPPAIGIGFAQSLALIPGVSRSGATMSAALALGYTRDSAAEFSFLMSAPIIAGAAALKLRHLSASDFTGPFCVGVASSALVGALSIRFFLNVIGRVGLKPYAVYRVVLAAAVLIIYAQRG